MPRLPKNTPIQLPGRTSEAWIDRRTRKAIEKRIEAATAALATLTDERKSFEMRWREPEQERLQACMPLAVADKARQRIAKIERANPRPFGPLEDGDG